PDARPRSAAAARERVDREDPTVIDKIEPQAAARDPEARGHLRGARPVRRDRRVPDRLDGDHRVQGGSGSLPDGPVPVLVPPRADTRELQDPLLQDLLAPPAGQYRPPGRLCGAD